MTGRKSLALACVACGLWACDAAPAPEEARSYLERRAAFETRLVMQEASRFAPDTLTDLRPVFEHPLPGSLEVVRYPGDESELQGWLFVPAQVPEGGAPGLLVLHSGSALYPDHQIPYRQYMDAGFVVFWPTWRGEHGNPGYYERHFGEVDDAAAAARWLAAHASVDADRVYALGWSSGGGIAALLSLWDDVPLRHTASSGGIYGAKESDHLWTWARTPRADGSPGVPFDTARAEEFALRALPGNTQWMKRPHFAFVETEVEGWVGSIAELERARARGDTLIHVTMLPGDHFSIFPEVATRYLELIRADWR